MQHLGIESTPIKEMLLLKQIIFTRIFCCILQCFSAADLLVDLNLPINGNIKKKMVPKLHMAIISKLLQKQCIKIKYENPLPCTSYFAINLFQEYAHNNVIYKESVQELMKNLKLGRQLKNENYLQEELSESKFARRKRRRSSNLRKNQHGNFSNVYEKVSYNNYTEIAFSEEFIIKVI